MEKIAVCCFRERLFDREVQELAAANLLYWRVRFKGPFERIAETHPPRIDVDLEALANMPTAHQTARRISGN